MILESLVKRLLVSKNRLHDTGSLIISSDREITLVFAHYLVDRRVKLRFADRDNVLYAELGELAARANLL